MQKPLVRRLTARYALALSLIALVIVSSYLLLTQRIDDRKDDAYIVNISGMQRMLSQRIALLANEIYITRSPEQARLFLNKLEPLADKMQSNHQILVAQANPESPVGRLYFGAENIDQRVSDYVALAQAFISLYQTEGLAAVQNSALARDIAAIARNGLLAALDSVVSQYQRESEQNVAAFKRLEAAVCVIGLLVLLAEVLFIFRPMVKEIAENTEALETSNEELRTFSYRISHDLRAPIVSCIGLMQVANHSLEKGDSSVAKTCLSHMDGSLKKLEALIGDILNLTKTKMTDVEPERVNINDLIQSSVKNLENLPNFQQVNIRHETDGQNTVVTKKLFLQQIVENLLSNAIKYHDPAEAQPSITIKESHTPTGMSLAFIDNGLGIPEKSREKMFTMFNRFHPKTSFGSGLGLYLIAQNAKSLNGEIIYTPGDKGSVFTLTMPLRNGELAA